ncbi:hypothetical protein [Mammaliicoccus sciuri]|uniref:hypothetical protein n=1 Tax=Mammaliicoccus sciuri TaxID=1296 RepID=UPI0021CFFF53|nr:hypothetical protein [Mammaliicoccus sciuri]UXV33154.1 hypothetical protein MUA60_05080 [Mammaliicoccus sciuri]
MYRVEYSILSYYPDLYLKSNIAVGVAFQIVGEDYFKNEVKLITQRKKLLSFDDELDNLNVVNLFLNGIKDEFENTNESIRDYVKRFVNNFYFEKIDYRIFNTLEDALEFIEVTYKYILHLGLDKKERLKNQEKRKYTMKYLESKYENISSKHVIHGVHSLDKFTPDFIAEDKTGKKILFKYLNKNNTAIHNARSYIMYAHFNNQDLVLILEQGMDEEKELLKTFSKELNAQVTFKFEKELVEI